jgi:hypothetical protein
MVMLAMQSMLALQSPMRKARVNTGCVSRFRVAQARWA